MESVLLEVGTSAAGGTKWPLVPPISLDPNSPSTCLSPSHIEWTPGQKKLTTNSLLLRVSSFGQITACLPSSDFMQAEEGHDFTESPF